MPIKPENKARYPKNWKNIGREYCNEPTTGASSVELRIIHTVSTPRQARKHILC